MAHGLTVQEAERRLREHGPNALPKAAPVRVWRHFLAQFRSPLIYILLFALVLDVAIWAAEGHGLPLEAAAIGAILLLNAALGVWQERKAEAALAHLEALAAPRVWVKRDGSLMRVPAADLVPGDAIRLEAGDRIPADVAFHGPQYLAVNESILTGESYPVEKTDEAEGLAGTLIVRGTTYGEVLRTGAASALGRLATLLGGLSQEKTPLERRLTAFGHRVARWVLVAAAVVAVAGLIGEGVERIGEVLLFAAALAVAAVPEGLPAILTVTLALGVERMAKRNAVVRRLSAVEALGSVTVIATDKTGTLTENRLEVRDLESEDGDEAFHAIVLANDAEPGAVAGDPVDVALLRYAEHCGVGITGMRSAYARDAVRPFDSATKSMRVTGTRADRRRSYVKGAPEVILERCAMADGERRARRDRIETLAADGYRLLALAAGEGECETDLTWIGLALLWDPPRPEVPEAIRGAREAGIRVVMITGDHPATAATVARAVGISHERVVTGPEIAAADDSALRRLVTESDVFARVEPEHKLRIVDALRAGGEIVAVTGDGVNDAPALKRADVGVAMGERGSDVSREVADVVLLDDNFATIVAAVEEGRAIYANIQKVIRFLFSTNLSEIIVVGVGAFAALALGLRDAGGGLLLPLTAAQLLWINLVTDGAPALALAVDENAGLLTRPPRNPAEPLLDRLSLRFVLVSGLAKAGVALLLLLALPRLFAEDLEVSRTGVFLFMAVGQLLFTYPARHAGLPTKARPVIHLAVLAGFLVQAAVLTVPVLMRAFDAAPLTVAVLAWVGVGLAGALGMAEITARVVWPRRPGQV